MEFKTDTVNLHPASREGEPIDAHIRAAVFAELIERAAPGVKYYRSDFWWDTEWLREHLAEDEVFLYSWDEAGTSIGTDPDLALRRENRLSLKLRRDERGRNWLLDVTPLPDED